MTKRSTCSVNFCVKIWAHKFVNLSLKMMYANLLHLTTATGNTVLAWTKTKMPRLFPCRGRRVWRRVDGWMILPRRVWRAFTCALRLPELSMAKVMSRRMYVLLPFGWGLIRTFAKRKAKELTMAQSYMSKCIWDTLLFVLFMLHQALYICGFLL